MKPFVISKDDLSDRGVADLLNAHLSEMHKYSPAESIHALDEAKLRDKAITFWSARIDNQVVGCGALRQFSAQAAELKSMKTASGFLRLGIAREILQRIINEARSRDLTGLYLETGTHAAFEPAVKLYQRFGFQPCAPFAEYQEDPHSRFFSLELAP